MLADAGDSEAIISIRRCGTRDVNIKHPEKTIPEGGEKEISGRIRVYFVKGKTIASQRGHQLLLSI